MDRDAGQRSAARTDYSPSCVLREYRLERQSTNGLAVEPARFDGGSVHARLFATWVPVSGRRGRLPDRDDPDLCHASRSVYMKNPCFLRLMKWLTPGAILLQAGGCTLEMINELLQTFFLGITAAGAIAILDNI